jgi:hypothetical protein
MDPVARATRTAVLAVALIAVTAATAAAQTKTPTVVLSGGSLYHSVDVAPNSIRTFTVTCPPGWFAMSGTVSDAQGATPLKSAPAGVRAWTFSVGLPVTAAKAAHVTVLVVCAKPKQFLLGLPGKAKAAIKLKTAKSKPVVIAPGGTEDTKLRCPAGSAPAGSGLEVAPVGSAGPRSAPVRAADVLTNGQVARETTDMPVRGGFEFTVRNPAGVQQTVRHSARCLARRATYRRRHRRRKRRARTKIVRIHFADEVAPGSNLFEHSAAAGEVPIFSGHRYGSGMDVIVLGHAVGRPRRVLTPVISQEKLHVGLDEYMLASPGDLVPLPR